MPFLRRTINIWDTQDLPGRFKEWKSCLEEILQTAYKLEKILPIPIFPWQRTWHINVWRMVGETCLRGYFCGSLLLSGTIMRQSLAPR